MVLTEAIEKRPSPPPTGNSKSNLIRVDSFVPERRSSTPLASGTLANATSIVSLGKSVVCSGTIRNFVFRNGPDHLDASESVGRSARADNPRLQPQSGTHLDLLPSHTV